MLTLAPVSALEARLGLPAGSMTDPDLGRATAALEDASALVRAEAGRPFLNDDGDAVTAPAAVVTIVVQAALRAFRNPEGFATESLGDYSYRLTDEAASVYLTEEEKRIVRDAGGVSSYGVVSVRTPTPFERPVETASEWEVPLP